MPKWTYMDNFKDEETFNENCTRVNVVQWLHLAMASVSARTIKPRFHGLVRCWLVHPFNPFTPNKRVISVKVLLCIEIVVLLHSTVTFVMFTWYIWCMYHWYTISLPISWEGSHIFYMYWCKCRQYIFPLQRSLVWAFSKETNL